MKTIAHLFLIYCFLFGGKLYTQNLYTATIINTSTNQPFSNCLVSVTSINAIINTDSLGRIQIDMHNEDSLELMVLGLNCHIPIMIPEPKNTYDPVYIFCPPYQLPEIAIEYVDGLTIMQKAAAQVTQLYADSSYIAFGFYRNYKKINNRFQEITESNMAAVMRIEQNQEKLTCNEAFGLQEIRRTQFTIGIDQFYDKALYDLFRQNPIYHHEYSLLTPYFLRHGDFYIDTASTDSTWVIKYTLRGITGENHGVDNYSPEEFYGEADESGYYVINKADHAILKIVRDAKRDAKYEYPKNNNFIMPDLHYTGEFEEGFLEINYVLFEGKYYAKNIFHAHTNSFTHVATNQEVYRITDYSEWICDSIGFIIDDELMQDLAVYEHNENVQYRYEPNLWELVPPFFFVKADIVMNDIKKRGQLNELFVAGGK